MTMKHKDKTLTLRKYYSSRFPILVALLLTIPLYFFSTRHYFPTPPFHFQSLIINNSSPTPFPTADRHPPETKTITTTETIIPKALIAKKCDLFTGDWVPNPDGPYYTNSTCNAIQEHQHCQKFGRPDSDYLMWKWKPDNCQLPNFDPLTFLKIVRGKSIAFIGDSVARNHLQSLVCLLSKVTYPTDVSNPMDQNRRYEYRDHDFNVSLFWSPYLVQTGELTNIQARPFDLYLDEFDPYWPSQLPALDYVILSAGHWFFRPTYFYLNNRLAACLYCPEPKVRHRSASFSYRRAFRTAFQAVEQSKGFRGVVFLRTFAPSHFENGPWDNGGICPRTRPFRREETELEDYTAEMYRIQMEEVRIARRKKVKVRVMDVTNLMQMRADGHPSKYWRMQGVNGSFHNDCVHWCLPGPIDTWSEFLQEMLIQERNKM